MKNQKTKPEKPHCLRSNVKRVVIFLGRKIYKICCVCYLLGWPFYAYFSIGEMSTPEPYKWTLPFSVFFFLLPPVFFAYVAGKEDAYADASNYLSVLLER